MELEDSIIKDLKNHGTEKEKVHELSSPPMGTGVSRGCEESFRLVCDKIFDHSQDSGHEPEPHRADHRLIRKYVTEIQTQIELDSESDDDFMALITSLLENWLLRHTYTYDHSPGELSATARTPG